MSITGGTITYGGSYKTHYAVRAKRSRMKVAACQTSCAMLLTRKTAEVTCKKCLAYIAKLTPEGEP